MQEVIGDLMSTLWGHLKPQNNPFGPRVLNLLGKMGGRNRRFLRSPAELEYKDNPEHGLRLILTFQPSTSFLVPLDRSIALCRAAVNGTGTGMPRCQWPSCHCLYRIKIDVWMKRCGILPPDYMISRGVYSTILSVSLCPSVSFGL